MVAARLIGAPPRTLPASPALSFPGSSRTPPSQLVAVRRSITNYLRPLNEFLYQPFQ
jgi:hypothetical protein